MNFWFKLFNFLLCVCVIFGYNFFVDINAKDNTIKELNTKVSSLEKQVEYDDTYIEDIKTKINKNNGKESKVEETATSSTTSSTTSSKYKDGTYDGEAKGFGGNIKVSLTVKDDKITEINVVSADKEDSSYLASAKNIINTMIDKQSTDVDTVSGATFSSTGIKKAATIALSKALK